MSCLKPLNELLQTPPPEDSVAVFGGTFDPIHVGHLEVVRSLLEIFSFVILAPTTSNPWKREAPTALAHRVEMIRLVCRAENLPLTENKLAKGVFIEERGYVYVAHYVRELERELAKPLFWVVGEDIADTVQGWKDWDSLGITTLVHPVNIAVHASNIREKQLEPHPAILEYCAKHALY